MFNYKFKEVTIRLVLIKTLLILFNLFSFLGIQTLANTLNENEIDNKITIKMDYLDSRGVLKDYILDTGDLIYCMVS